MARDILTMAWKEFRELLLLRTVAERRNPVFLIIVCGLIVPFLAKGLLSAALWFYMIQPALNVLSVIGDSFAGERERHTLETLLASRLPDRAILVGKFAAPLLYGWAVGFISLILAVGTAGVAHGWSNLIDIRVFGLALIAQPMLGTMVASLGLLISMRAPTVRRTHQTLVLIFFGSAILCIAGIQLLPADAREWLLKVLNTWSPVRLAAAVLFVLLAVDVILFYCAIIRCKRTNLILT